MYHPSYCPCKNKYVVLSLTLLCSSIDMISSVNFIKSRIVINYWYDKSSVCIKSHIIMWQSWCVKMTNNETILYGNWWHMVSCGGIKHLLSADYNHQKNAKWKGWTLRDFLWWMKRQSKEMGYFPFLSICIHTKHQTRCDALTSTPMSLSHLTIKMGQTHIWILCEPNKVITWNYLKTLDKSCPKA